MGRMKKIAEAPTSNALVASAAVVSGRGMSNLSRVKIGRMHAHVNELGRSGNDDGWQRQAWEFYRTIGEFRFSCDWVGAALSKAILFAKLNGDGVSKGKPMPSGRAAELVQELFGDEEDRAEMLRLMGIHFTVAGECFIVAYDAEDDGTERIVWNIVASTELRVTNGRYSINSVELPVEDHTGVMVIRAWRPDPVKINDASSPSRAVLNILGEISRLTDHVAAQVDSRLAGAGILLMPSEMTFPAPPVTEGSESTAIQVNNAESLMAVLQDTMATAIEDRSDASALVPIVITAPADAIAAVKHMTFWTELDEHAIELRSEAIRRLGLGMDMPPEVLQGSADSNHWSAWQADEAAIKSHTEPLLKIITTSLARGYLRPLLRSEGVDDADHYAIGADTSEMRLRPNRSKEALELYNLGELSGVALRRETGFDESDAMDDSERAQWFLRKVASGSTTPELVEAALRALNVPIGEIARDGSGDETQEARPDPSLKDHPTREIPDMDLGMRRKELRESPENLALVAAGEQLVVRALERSGNRLKNKMQVPSGIDAMNLYRVAPREALVPEKLLEDAWGHAETVAARHGISEGQFSIVLDMYCRGLFDSGQGHNYERFSAFMNRAIDTNVLELGA